MTVKNYPFNKNYEKNFLASILVVLFNTSYSQNNEGFFGENFLLLNWKNMFQ